MEKVINAVIVIFVVILGVAYIGSISKRSYWKERYLEIQDNYDAISRENSDLRDTIDVLKDSLRLSPIHK